MKAYEYYRQASAVPAEGWSAFGGRCQVLDMKAVVFAAGRGTRMGALAMDRPKPLIEVAGKSVLAHGLDAMPDAVDEIIIVVGHLGEKITGAWHHFSEQVPGIKIRFAEQRELTGTYDALLAARPHLGDTPFLVMNGDDIYSKDGLARLIEGSDPLGSDPCGYAVLAKRVARPNRYSHLETNEGGFLKGIASSRDLPPEHQLPETRTYTGAALLDPGFFDLEPASIPKSSGAPGAGAERSLPHTLEKHLNKRPVRVIDSSLWIPVGNPEELTAAEDEMMKWS